MFLFINPHFLVPVSYGSGPFYNRLTAFLLLNVTTPVIREFDLVVNIVIYQLLRLVNLPIQLPALL